MNDNVRSKDRILELAPVEGSPALSSQGVPDKRLFTGEQKLHIKMDPSTSLWYCQWEKNGLLPQGLEGRFTGFKAAIKHAEDYFRKRNVRITQVRD